MNLEEQYDKIYRYCYFKVHNRETAEDITQEAFLHFFESGTYQDTGRSLQYLYTIARNLCTDEYRRRRTEPLDDSFPKGYAEDSTEDTITARLSVRLALAALEETDRELLLLRYVNETPVSVIASLLGISRFAVRRRVMQAVRNLKEQLKED